MKTIRKNLKLFSICMSFAILFMSCEQYDSSGEIDDQNLNNYTGEQIFNGIFFSKGDVVKLFPEISHKTRVLQQLTEEEKKSLKEFQENVLFILKSNEEDFFKNFKNSMTSKDHDLIKKELQKTKQKLVEVTKNIFKLDSKSNSDLHKEALEVINNNKTSSNDLNIEKLRQKFNNSTDAKNPDPLELLAVVLVAVAVAVWAWVYFYDANEDDQLDFSKNSLKAENLINSIVLKS